MADEVNKAADCQYRIVAISRGILLSPPIHSDDGSRDCLQCEVSQSGNCDCLGPPKRETPQLHCLLAPRMPFQCTTAQNDAIAPRTMAATNIFDSSAAPLPGQRATETAHRRIELQSPADLQYLIANVSRAAREKIDKHFPPEAAPESGEDDMRKRVEVLVDEYIRRTFAAAKDGMSINGMDSREMEREMEKAREGEGAWHG